MKTRQQTRTAPGSRVDEVASYSVRRLVERSSCSARSRGRRTTHPWSMLALRYRLRRLARCRGWHGARRTSSSCHCSDGHDSSRRLARSPLDLSCTVTGPPGAASAMPCCRPAAAPCRGVAGCPSCAVRRLPRRPRRERDARHSECSKSSCSQSKCWPAGLGGHARGGLRRAVRPPAPATPALAVAAADGAAFG